MQNNTLMYVVGAVVVVILALGAWMLVGKGGGPASPLGNEIASTTQNNNQSMTLKDAFAMQGSHMCNVSSQTDSGASTGTVYIANGMMRGDFTSMMGSTTYLGHMIIKDKTNYFWTDSPKQGFKMAFDVNATTSTQNNQSIDPNVKMSYTCNDWSTDNTKFELPAGITFRELTTVNSSNLSAQCGACDQIPDATAKAQCRVALKCK